MSQPTKQTSFLLNTLTHQSNRFKPRSAFIRSPTANFHNQPGSKSPTSLTNSPKPRHQICISSSLMGFTMGLNLLLLLAMVATNILSLYHLASTVSAPKPPSSSVPMNVPDHLLRQLHTLRATLSHLSRHQQPPPSDHQRPFAAVPSDLLLLSHLSAIPSACHNLADLLHKFMSYAPFSLCPDDTALQETLILHGCHPLPRRRCFSRTPSKIPRLLPSNPFTTSLPDSAVVWNRYGCKSFECLAKNNPNLGLDFVKQRGSLVSYSSELDLPIPQFLQIAKAANSPIRLGIDIGGGTASFAAAMKELHNATIVTTTLNVNAPNSEVVALRGLVPLHVPLQQRLPVFDGVMDLVRCGRAVNRWIPTPVLEFMLYDIDRVLRAGGFFWIDRFFSRRFDLDKVYAPLIMKLGYKKVKWAVANKTDSSGLRNGEVYLTALLQKPK